MKCVRTFGTSRHKCQEDISLWFEYIRTHLYSSDAVTRCSNTHSSFRMIALTIDTNCPHTNNISTCIIGLHVTVIRLVQWVGYVFWKNKIGMSLIFYSIQNSHHLFYILSAASEFDNGMSLNEYHRNAAQLCQS